MTNTLLKLAMWAFDAKLEELRQSDMFLAREKLATLNHLAMIDSVLWAAFGRTQRQTRYDC